MNLSGAIHSHSEYGCKINIFLIMNEEPSRYSCRKILAKLMGVSKSQNPRKIKFKYNLFNGIFSVKCNMKDNYNY